MGISNARQNIKSHPSGSVTVALSISAFLIGGELLTVGRESVSEAYSSGIAFLLALLILSAAASAARTVFEEHKNEKAPGIFKRISVSIFSVLAAAASLFVVIETAMDFSGFAADVMLLRAPRLPVAIIFLIFCTFLASKGERAVRKFAFLSAVAVGACAALLILLSLPSLDIKDVTFDKGSIDVGYTVSSFVRKFAPVCIALVYFSLGCGEKKSCARLTPPAAFLGVLIGGAILTICHFNVTLLLGSALARGESIPYSSAVGALSTGKLFMRVEGLSYAMYFFSMSSRLSIAIGTLIALSKRFLPLRR